MKTDEPVSPEPSVTSGWIVVVSGTAKARVVETLSDSPVALSVTVPADIPSPISWRPYGRPACRNPYSRHLP